MEEDTPRPEVDPKDIFLHAFRFHWSSMRLREKKHITAEETAFASEPSQALAALAAELYLKCLIFVETGRTPGDTQNLKDLFHQLSEMNQQRIETLWDQVQERSDLI